MTTPPENSLMALRTQRVSERASRDKEREGNALCERIDRTHIQMVGRLIEEEDVRVLEGELGEDDAVAKSVGELADGRRLVGSRDSESSDRSTPVLHVLFGEFGLVRGLKVLEGRHVVGELVGRVLRVLGCERRAKSAPRGGRTRAAQKRTELEGGVTADGSLEGLERSSDEVEEGGLSSSVLADDGDTGVHAAGGSRSASAQKGTERRSDALDTEGEILVESILHLTRIGEGDLVEGDDGRGELSDVLKVEEERLLLADLLDEAGSLHLVDDLQKDRNVSSRPSSSRKSEHAPFAWTWPA